MGSRCCWWPCSSHGSSSCSPFDISSVDRSRRNSGPDDGFIAIRPAVFVFMFAADISMSFVPLHMERLYQPMFGLSPEVVFGLPVSVEFLFVGLALVASGAWLDKRGWREPFLAGIVSLAGAGMVHSCLASSPFGFITSRAVVGAGYGLALMAAQGYVVANTNERNRTQGLAHLFAGLYGGSICGGTVGAILADRVGYPTVFMLGAAVLFGLTLVMLVFGSARSSAPESRAPERPWAEERRLVHFLRDPSVLSTILFSSFPAAVVIVGFLNYFAPVYLNRLGASQTTIGQVLLLYGMCLVLFGPPISRLADRMRDKRYPVFVGSLVGAGGLLIFALVDGIGAAVVATVMLGVSSSFVLASQSAYVLQTEVARRLGPGKSLGVFRATSRVGQMLGPIIFGAMIATSGMEGAAVQFGVAYLVFALLFVAFAQFPAAAGGQESIHEQPASSRA